MRTAKPLIRLGIRPGWSESSLGAHPFCWFCHEATHLWFLPRRVSRCFTSLLVLLLVMFSVLFSIVITSPGEVRAGVYCFSCICMFIFRDWNALPDSLISSTEGAEDGVAKFTSLVRSPRSWCWWMIVVLTCHQYTILILILHVLHFCLSLGIGRGLWLWHICLKTNQTRTELFTSDTSKSHQDVQSGKLFPSPQERLT